jgi:hypothetical protein
VRHFGFTEEPIEIVALVVDTNHYVVFNQLAREIVTSFSLNKKEVVAALSIGLVAWQ